MIDNTSNCQHGARAHRTVACTDPRIVWSPYNWLDVPKNRSTPLVGAYINVTFTGDVVGIGVDASYLDPTDATPEALVVSARVDGTEPQHQSFADMHNDALVWSGLGPGMHTARITLAMNGHFATRWNGSPPSGLTVTGVVIAGELLDMDADQRNAPRALFYGDSITEGNNIEEFGTFGDNSFAVTAMDELGVQFGLHAHSLLM